MTDVRGRGIVRERYVTLSYDGHVSFQVVSSIRLPDYECAYKRFFLEKYQVSLPGR